MKDVIDRKVVPYVPSVYLVGWFTIDFPYIEKNIIGVVLLYGK